MLICIFKQRKNNIIIISGDVKSYIFYNTSKVYKIIQKPVNTSELLKTIYEIQNIIDLDNLKKEIDDLFFRLKLLIPSYKGVNYLKQAVIYCLEDEKLFYNITNVYTLIANKNSYNNIKPQNVLWSLESLIDSYTKNVDKKFLSSILNYFDETRNLTPKYLIELIVINLKNKTT